MAVSSRSDNSPVGSLFMTSFSGEHSELDYALIRVQDDRQQDMNHLNHFGSIYTIRAIVKNGPYDTSVLMTGRFHERLHGTISSASSYLRLPYSTCFQELYTAYFNDPLEVGDCGSWVVDAATGDLFGHIILGDPVRGSAYIVPATATFNDIGLRLHVTVHLPLGDTITVPTPNQLGSQLDRRSSAPTHTRACPYHERIFQGSPLGVSRQSTGLARYLEEGPGEQHALFLRPDNGKLSTNRDCHCETVGPESDID